MNILELFARINPRVPGISRPYIIAEIGVNHEGSMELARRLIDDAAEGGANAVKFQTYKAHTLASKDSPAYWDTTKESTKSQYELFSKHDSFWKSEMEELKGYSDTAGVEFLSTPFDVESATFLNDLMPVFKISSSDITNKPFIQYIARFGKPIILSTGASELYEIQEAVSWIDAEGVPAALLHCVLNYPTSDGHANLGRILGLREAFPGRIVGYSDHTLPKDMHSCEIAVLFGAAIIEKHFTHDKSLPGNDHYHAMDKKDLVVLLNHLNRDFELYGDCKVRAFDFEKPAIRNARRSLVAARDIGAGMLVDKADLTFKRPAYGISPRVIDEIIGRRTSLAIAADSVLQWKMFE
jgi:N-acetylneuraminate synthase